MMCEVVVELCNRMTSLFKRALGYYIFDRICCS